MRILFISLFWVIALGHLVCSPVVVYMALWSKTFGIWMLLPIAFLPLAILISFHRMGRWSCSHRVLAVIALLPAMWFALDEFYRRYTPNKAWLFPVISVYTLALIGSLIIKESKRQNKSCEATGVNVRS